MIESNCLEFLTKLREILISGIQENSQKPVEQKWLNFGPKKGKKMTPIFLSEQKFSLTIFKQ